MVVLVLLLVSCSKDHDADRSWYHPFEAMHYTSIWNKDSNVVRAYKYAYGIGATTVLHYETSVWVNVSGWLWPWEPGYGTTISVRDRYAFPLRLDANRDSVTYCFVANDDSRDTVSISYTRHFKNYVTDAYVYTPENLRISFLSSRFLADSCAIKPRNYYGLGDQFNQTNMRLMLKP